MASENLWRDSLIVAAMVILFAYAAALTLNLIMGPSTANLVTPKNAFLVSVLYLVVVGLGFVLWRGEADASES